MPAWSKSLKSYNKATSAVYLDGIVGYWFRTTVVVRQRCLLSLTLFNIFLGGNYDSQYGSRTITNLHFADDIGGLVRKEEELAYVVDRLDKIFAAMEISA